MKQSLQTKLTIWQNDVLTEIIWGGHIQHWIENDSHILVMGTRDDEKDISETTFNALFENNLIKEYHRDEEKILYK